jgi:hypothetical protein
MDDLESLFREERGRKHEQDLQMQQLIQELQSQR